MIPIRDDQARRRFTAVNMALIAADVAVFMHEVALGPDAGAFVVRYAMIPARVAGAFGGASGATRIAADPRTMAALGTLVTSMFLHGGLLHIAGNMLYLFIFGAAVEEAMGHGRFLCFYLASGIAAACATVAFAPHSHVPVIGASGAIAGVLGAYFIFYPQARILTLLPLFIIYFLEVPAVVYLLIWFAIQLYFGLETVGPGAVAGGVAWWAHVGGFLFGMALGPLVGRHYPRRGRRR
jgi:rhomboid family protein